MPEGPVPDEEKKRRRYPIPRVKPDRSGRIAAETLQYFVAHPGPHTATEVLRDRVVGKRPLADGGEKGIRMNLLHYSRQGLLRRERKGREYRYQITKSGENRLIFLWDRMGLTDPSKAASIEAREEMRRRLAIVDSILAERENEALEVHGRPISE